MTRPENFREIALSVSEDLSERDEIDAILLVGSTATGHADEYSDIDFQVVGPDESGERVADGVHIEWNSVTRKGVEGKLGNWEDDAALYTYAHAELLYDRIGLAEVLATYEMYPPKIHRKKLYSGWFYGTGNTFDAQKAAERDDTRVKQCAAVAAVEQFAALTYLLNGRFPPYRKWLFRDLPIELPDLDRAVSGDISSLESISSKLKSGLRDILDDEQIESPYLHQPEFGPLG
jgi:predicted nucleotidyltransferase